ncbi:hypothetical protein FRC03_009437 [Tulasnella sp. 419]|nr:hypothetical protein FRC03_009437 [Tulasnella sp. 419]
MPSNTRLLASFALLAAIVSAAPAESITHNLLVARQNSGDKQPSGNLIKNPEVKNGKQFTASTFAATAWYTTKKEKSGYNQGVRVFYDSEDPQRCDGIQELTAWGGQVEGGKVAQAFSKTYCFPYNKHRIIRGSALAATSLTREDKLVDLRLFYWIKESDGVNVIKASRWSPDDSDSNNDGKIDEAYSNEWGSPNFEFSHRVNNGDTNHLSALAWMDSKYNRHWSVFYIEDGTWLKEMTIGNYRQPDGKPQLNWHNGGLQSCGEQLHVDLSKNIKKIGRIQATMWVNNDNIYKRIYVLDTETGKIHEYGSTSSMKEFTTAVPVKYMGEVKVDGNVKSFAVNTDGKGSGLRLYANIDDRVTEYWPNSGADAQAYKADYKLSTAEVSKYDRASDAAAGTMVVSAFQRYNDQTYQFVFYVGKQNGESKLKMSQRDMNYWIHGVPAVALN